MVNATKERGYQSLTTDASQVEIVTLAVYLCGGGVKMVDTEDAAVKANELAPGRFSWRKYPEQINIELVRSYLSAAKRRAGYLNGTGTQGWSLTPAGLAWAESAGQEFLVTDQSRRRDERKGGGVDEQRWQRERARITGTRAYQKWVTGDEGITVREAEGVFRIDRYVNERTRHAEITRLQDMFRDDQAMASFVDAAAAIVAKKKEG
jgi:hypothetical protein